MIRKLATTVATIVVVTLISGCQDAAMRDRGFAEGHPVIMIEEVTGNRYVVELHAGNVYTVKPLNRAESEEAKP